MRRPVNHIIALLLTVLLSLAAVSVPVAARAENAPGDMIAMGDRLYRDGLGPDADLAGAKSALLAAVETRSFSVDLSSYGLGTAQLADIYDQIFFEHPSLFYLEDGYTYSLRPARSASGTVVVSRVEPSYYRELTDRDAARYEAAVEEALALLRPEMTDFDKALVLHDYLAAHCSYDDSLTRYSPYYALVSGSAVCQGYLLAYSDLLNRAGVTNYPAVSSSQNHGWNTVELDGLWYHVDVTWDHPDGVPSDWVLHTDFLLSDEGIRRTGSLHQNWVTPNLCTGDRYESSFLSALRAPVLYPPEGGAWFLLDGRLCRSEDLSSLQYEVVSSAGRGAWSDTRTGMTYSPRDARLVYWAGSIYYTDSTNIYRYDLASGKTSLHGRYLREEGFLYGLSVSGSGSAAVLTAQVRAFPEGRTLDVFRLDPVRGAEDPHALVCPSRVFTDVSAGQWFHEPVDYALEAGLMKGVSETEFSPGGVTTRAMLVTILYRMEETPAAEAPAFSDVKEGAWYFDAVGWAASCGIVTGVAEDAFRPDDPVTREQLAAILCRYARYKGLETETGADLSGFTDAPRISSYARTSLAWAVETGLITGRSADTLAPKDTASRAETAAILMRLSGLPATAERSDR